MAAEPCGQTTSTKAANPLDGDQGDGVDEGASTDSRAAEDDRGVAPIQQGVRRVEVGEPRPPMHQLVPTQGPVVPAHRRQHIKDHGARGIHQLHGIAK